MRKKIIAGNWKMNTNANEARQLVRDLLGIDFNSANSTVVLFPPLLYLSEFTSTTEFLKINFGSQNCHHEDAGAFTGEVSPAMLKAVGLKFGLVGHSERRQHFHETDAQCHAKLRALLKHDITPILCVGESLEVREFSKHNEFVEAQLRNCLFDLSSDEILKVVIAYEPVWAIGTGKTATTQQASEMHSFIRDYISVHYKQVVSEKVSILYGGSVKDSNAKELMTAKDIDGVLVGGASLDAGSFAKIIGSV